MVHAGHEEQAVVVVNVHGRVRKREPVDGLVIVDTVAWADELVGPSDVLNEFPLVLRPSKGGEVGIDRLRRARFSPHRENVRGALRWLDQGLSDRPT